MRARVACNIHDTCVRVHDCTALDCSLLRLYGLHSAHTQYVYFESVSVRVTVYGLSFFLIDVLYGCMRTVTDSCCIGLWLLYALQVQVLQSCVLRTRAGYGRAASLKLNQSTTSVC